MEIANITISQFLHKNKGIRPIFHKTILYMLILNSQNRFKVHSKKSQSNDKPYRG